VLTDIVRLERDQGIGRLQQRIKVRRRRGLDQVADELGEVAGGIGQCEVEERGRQETRRADEGHDLVIAVFYETVLVQVRRAEAQAVFPDLGAEADTMALPYCYQNL
jgi:hypothetical protein